MSLNHTLYTDTVENLSQFIEDKLEDKSYYDDFKLYSLN